jgi:hypothetical protein
MKAVDRFNTFFDIFKKTDLWRSMLCTREDSPWHREENVAEHTRMLIMWYQRNLLNYRNERQNILTLVSCLMHDVGKPLAQVVKTSEERGVYRAYTGHELISARIWSDYALSNFMLISDLFRFKLDDISNISFFLEHHVPFGLKNETKRSALKRSIIARTGEEGHRAWLDLLLSDQHGRISDDQATKLDAVDEWMHNWKQV